MFVMTVNNSCSKEENASTGNPLLDEWNTEMGIPPFDKIRAEHYEPAFEEAMKVHNEEIDAIVRNEAEPTFENVILALHLRHALVVGSRQADAGRAGEDDASR